DESEAVRVASRRLAVARFVAPSSTTTTTNAPTVSCRNDAHPPTPTADGQSNRPRVNATTRTTVITSGRITLRVNGRMHHIGLGAEHNATRVVVLVHDLEVRVANATTGELIRALTINPTKDYQPLDRPPGPTPHQPR
ncbi:MAG: hypothetical protein ABWY80_07205, partial [Acidimicrobiia bacterium]